MEEKSSKEMLKKSLNLELEEIEASPQHLNGLEILMSRVESDRNSDLSLKSLLKEAINSELGIMKDPSESNPNKGLDLLKERIESDKKENSFTIPKLLPIKELREKFKNDTANKAKPK